MLQLIRLSLDILGQPLNADLCYSVFSGLVALWNLIRGFSGQALVVVILNLFSF